jgi:hypothetical protein
VPRTGWQLGECVGIPADGFNLPHAFMRGAATQTLNGIRHGRKAAFCGTNVEAAMASAMPLGRPRATIPPTRASTETGADKNLARLAELMRELVNNRQSESSPLAERFGRLDLPARRKVGCA